MSVSPQEFVVAPCLSGRQYCSPRLAGRSDLYFFQMTVFPLSPGTCEILYVPFKNEISISLSSLGLWKLSTTGLQSQVLWGLLFPVQDPWVREHNVRLRPLLLGGLLPCNYTLVCGSPIQGFWNLIIPWLCFSYLSHCGSSFMSLVVDYFFSDRFYWVSGEGNGTPLQYSCLENPMDGGAWWAAVHGVARSQTRLSNFTFTFHFHALEKVMATHSSVLAWRIPGMGEPGGLPSMGSHRVRHDWSDLAAATGFHDGCSTDGCDFGMLNERWAQGLSTLPPWQKVPRYAMLLCFFFFFPTLHSLQDLGSRTRDWTCAPAVEAQSPNHWTAKKFPGPTCF